MGLKHLGIGSVAFLLLVLTICILRIPSASAPAAPPNSSFMDFSATRATNAREHISRALQFATLTRIGTETSDAAETKKTWTEFQNFLKSTYPHVFSQLEIQRFYSKRNTNEPDPSFLITWKGVSNAPGYAFLAHQDVVPVEYPEKWKHPPFSGESAENAIWGRGSLDDKSALIAILESAEFLLEQGYRPERTLYFIFGHDEETGGHEGARQIANYFREKQLKVDGIFDEGMTLITGAFPGLQKKLALIGVAQKGYLTIDLSVKAQGGHSSMPPTPTAIGRLAHAIDQIESHPSPAELTAPVEAMLKTVAPEMPFVQKLAFSNLWLFDPAVLSQLTKQPPTAALVRTTTATTLFHAGVKDNVLAQNATATVNLRLLPGDSSEGAFRRLKNLIDDDHVQMHIREEERSEGSPVASSQGAIFQALANATHTTFDPVIVAPALMIGSSDSKHFQFLTPNVYRFLPLDLKKEDLSQIHGENEHISVQNFDSLVHYFTTLFQLLSSPHASAPQAR